MLVFHEHIYCWKGISIALTSKGTNNVCQTWMDTPKTNFWLPPIAFVEEGWSRMLSHTSLTSLYEKASDFILPQRRQWVVTRKLSLLTCDGPLLGVHGEWWAQKCLPCPSLCSLHAHVLLGRVKRTAEKRTNPWHSNLARRPLVRLLANKCLHLLLHNPHFPPLTTSNGKFSLQWQNITHVVHALFQ